MKHSSIHTLRIHCLEIIFWFLINFWLVGFVTLFVHLNFCGKCSLIKNNTPLNTSFWLKIISIVFVNMKNSIIRNEL